MDFSYLMELAGQNKAESSKQAQVKRYTTEVSKPKKLPKSNVNPSAIQEFLKKRENEEKIQKESAQRQKAKLLAMRAANPKSNKAAKLMRSRTKDNDFSIIKLSEEEELLQKKVNAEMRRKETSDKLERMKIRIELEKKGRNTLATTKNKRKHNKDGEMIESYKNIDLFSANGSKNQEFFQPKEEYIPKKREIRKNVPVREVGLDVGIHVKKPEKRKIIKSSQSKVDPSQMDFNSLLKLANTLHKKPVSNGIAEESSVKYENSSKKKHGDLSTSNFVKKSCMNLPVKKIPKIFRNEQNGSDCKNVTKVKQKSMKPNISQEKLESFKKHDSKLKTLKNEKDQKMKHQRNHNSTSASEKFNKLDRSIKNGSSKQMVESIPSYRTSKEEKSQNSISRRNESVPLYKTTMNKSNNVSQYKTSSKNNGSLPSYSTGKTSGRQVHDKSISYSNMKKNPKLVENSSSKLNSSYSKPAIKSVQRRPPSPGSRFRGSQKNPMSLKRRIESDDECDEMDDFIDDGPMDNMDYSSHIKEIFGYDKSRYRFEDEDDIQEVSFAEQMKEECRSARIGLMEDLEDMRQEKAEERRKMLMKKKRKL